MDELSLMWPDDRGKQVIDPKALWEIEHEKCGCWREGRADGDGWHEDSCRHREIELDSRR